MSNISETQFQDVDSYELEIDLYDITGYELDYAYIDFGKVSNVSFDGNMMDMHLRTCYDDWTGETTCRHHMIEIHQGDGINYVPENGNSFYDETFEIVVWPCRISRPLACSRRTNLYLNVNQIKM